MKLFKCFIEGKNFPLRLDGENPLLGFYTTRFVHAETAEQAELLALELLRSDPNLDLDPSKRRKDTMVYFESIEEIDSIPDGISEPGTGYTFYPMGT
jgi:hypothetical protein